MCPWWKHCSSDFEHSNPNPDNPDTHTHKHPKPHFQHSECTIGYPNSG